jgi:hypothetical protein
LAQQSRKADQAGSAGKTSITHSTKQVAGILPSQTPENNAINPSIDTNLIILT